MANIVLYRMINGDEVVASEVSTGETATVIEDAVALVYHQTDKGVSVGFAPFMPQSDGKITLWHVGISAVSYPNEQIITEYKRIFSKIEVPSQKIII